MTLACVKERYQQVCIERPYTYQQLMHINNLYSYTYQSASVTDQYQMTRAQKRRSVNKDSLFSRRKSKRLTLS